MQVYANKLQSHLGKELARVYLVAGDDNLLRDDAAKTIRKAAQHNGFSENETFVQDATFSWSQLLDACSALSLFADKRLIEVKLSSSKIGVDGGQAVLDCISAISVSPEPDTILLINAPRIEGKPKWVKTITDEGVYTPVYPLDTHELPGWLTQRAKTSGLNLSREAAELLGERVEGNLVSAVQELEKLALLADKNQTVDTELVESSVADNARFTAFNMLDHAIDGDARSACKALQKIREEGSEGIAIIGAIAYQVRNLIALNEYARQNQLPKGLKAHRVLPKRHNAVSKAVQRLSLRDLQACTQLLGKADNLYKTGNGQIGWLTLEAVILHLAGKPLTVEPMLAEYQSI